MEAVAGLVYRGGYKPTPERTLRCLGTSTFIHILQLSAPRNPS